MLTTFPFTSTRIKNSNLNALLEIGLEHFTFFIKVLVLSLGEILLPIFSFWLLFLELFDVLFLGLFFERLESFSTIWPNVSRITPSSEITASKFLELYLMLKF